MATATTRSDLHLPALTSFLTLAPTTSACYPTHRRTFSSPTVVDSQKTIEPSSTAEAVHASEGGSIAEIPIIPTAATTVSEETETELKLRRSSSLSSDGSLKTFRFLRLGPVHHGEQNDDWSEAVEEVAVVG